MADKGFTKYISDFAGAIKENGDDIIGTTKEIERILNEFLEYLTNDVNLGLIKSGVQTSLDTLLGTLEAGEIFNVDDLKNKFETVVEDISLAINIDLKKSFDPDDILKTITDIIPTETFPEELGEFYTTLKEFFSNIDVSEIRIGAKIINDPVPKVNVPTEDTTTNQNASIDQSSGPTSFGSEATDPALETLFNDFIANVTTKITNESSLIERILGNFEQAVIESGFYNDLEEKKEEFIITVTSDGITISKILEAVSQLLLDLIESAIKAILAALDSLIVDLQEIFTFIKDVLLITETGESSAGSVVNSIFDQFDIDDYQPSLISVPAFLLSIPFTFFTKAVGYDLQSLTDFSLNDNENNKINGSLQISKTILPVIGLGSYRLSKNYKKTAIGVEMGGDVIGLTFDILGQLFDQPDLEDLDSLETIFWYLQWAKVGTDFSNMLYKVYVDSKDLNNTNIETNTSSTLHHKVDDRTKKILYLKTGLEFLNLGFLIVLDNSDEGKEDSRLRIGYYLDALPGILDGILSIAKIPKNKLLEQMEDSDKKLLTNLGKELDTAKTAINNISETEKGAYNTFYIDNNGISDLLFLHNKLSAIREVNNETRELLKSNFEEQTQVVELKETLNRIIDKIEQLLEKVTETQTLINEHQNKSYTIDELINEFNEYLPIIKYDLEESIEDYKSGIGDRITSTNENDIKLLKGNFELNLNILNGTKKNLNNIIIAIQQNELIRNFFFNSNREVSILLETEEIIASLERLVVEESFIENFSKIERDKLNTPISSMQSIAQELEVKKNEDPMSNQLGYYFPITEIPKGKIETIIAQISKGLFAIAQFEERRSSKADLEKLNKEIARLDYFNILFNAVIQLTYGSLQVNAGINQSSD